MIQAKKMPMGQFFKLIMSTIGASIKEIVLIALIFSLPGMLLGSSNFITSFITLLSTIVGMLSIIVLVDSKRKGINLKWIDATKTVMKNPLVPMMVFVLKNMFANLGYMIFPILGQIIVIFLLAALPFAMLEGKNVMESMKLSFEMVKRNFLDVLLKKLVVIVIINSIMMLVGGLFLSNFLASTFIILINIIMMIPDLILYYELKA